MIIYTEKRKPKHTHKPWNSDWWQEYHRYLLSYQWAHVRSARLAIDDHKCAHCGGSTILQAHHTHYPDNIWDTTTDDLLTLCYQCHRTEHWRRGKLKAITWEDHIRAIAKLSFPLEQPAINTLLDAKRFGDHRIRSMAGQLLAQHRKSLLPIFQSDRPEATAGVL